MNGQDNLSFRDRASSAVIEAIIDAGRACPGVGDSHVDPRDAMEAMGHAMATFAAVLAQCKEDPEKAAQEIADVETQIVSKLRFLADRAREGALSSAPTKRPKLRVVD